jgi:hypothetical protein
VQEPRLALHIAADKVMMVHMCGRRKPAIANNPPVDTLTAQRPPAVAPITVMNSRPGMPTQGHTSDRRSRQETSPDLQVLVQFAAPRYEALVQHYTQHCRNARAHDQTFSLVAEESETEQNRVQRSRQGSQR